MIKFIYNDKRDGKEVNIYDISITTFNAFFELSSNKNIVNSSLLHKVLKYLGVVSNNYIKIIHIIKE